MARSGRDSRRPLARRRGRTAGRTRAARGRPVSAARPGLRGARRTAALAPDAEEHLAPCAMRAALTRGRRHPEEEHPFRSPFQRDRDRIIHSRAFRRLEYKTQVFVNHEGDHFRTRLTHSIEISQVGRTAARALGLNQDLVEALALSHDLGHTPFGHLGEDVLDRLMKDHGGYNHNRQSLRIVEWLEDRYPRFPGLNLTYEVREGIAKHSGPIDVALAPEFAEYRPEEAPPLEAQMIDIVDEIGYIHHDVDDGVNSELLSAERLASDVPLFGERWRGVTKGFPGATERQRVAMALVGMIDYLVTDLVENSRRRIVDAGVTSVEEIRARREWLIAPSDRAAGRKGELKRYLEERLYRHHRIERVKEKSRRILIALFERYTENPLLLPESFQSRFETDGRQRVICDYVAGMTDRYAMNEYRRLFDAEVLF